MIKKVFIIISLIISILFSVLLPLTHIYDIWITILVFLISYLVLTMLYFLFAYIVSIFIDTKKEYT